MEGKGGRKAGTVNDADLSDQAFPWDRAGDSGGLQGRWSSLRVSVYDCEVGEVGKLGSMPIVMFPLRVLYGAAADVVTLLSLVLVLVGH